MYQCANCGAALRFDIKEQQLKCDACKSLFDPETIDPGDGAEENTSFGVTVFTCTQCGGELVSTDQSMTGFCPFCGSQSTLESRIGQENRPKTIIPFQKTKSACKKAYQEALKHAYYAPKELRDPEFLERFRGIYMPYWVYRVHFRDEVTLPAHRTYNRGDYTYEEDHTMTAKLKGTYENIQYDASSSFDDSIASQIAPFSAKKQRAFRPSYLAGFYADTADVEKDTYRQDAVDRVGEYAMEKVANDLGKGGYVIEKPTSKQAVEETLGTTCEEPEAALLPVWFLTWRRKDRVVYAVVNGENGRVHSDLPIDPRRFFLGTILLALVFFLLGNGILSMTAKTALSVAQFLGVVAGILYFYELRAIMRRENHLEDKGFFARHTNERAQKLLEKDVEKIRQKEKRSMPRIGAGVARVIALVVVVFLSEGLLTVIASVFLNTPGSLMGGIETLLAAVFFVRSVRLIPHVEQKTMALPALLAFLSVAASYAVTILKPVEDLVYYFATAGCLAAVAVVCIALIRRYNLLATRPVPDLFTRKGGDDRASDPV